MRIGIGCDNNAYEFKEEIVKYLADSNHVVVDYGCHTKNPVDYPDVAFTVAEAISEGSLDRGILICGTGIGVCIAANKYPGIRAALCHDVYSAERAQLSNNAQIITMGSQIIGVQAGKQIIDAFLRSEWAEGSKRKVDQIIEREKAFVNAEFKEAVTSK